MATNINSSTREKSIGLEILRRYWVSEGMRKLPFNPDHGDCLLSRTQSLFSIDDCWNSDYSKRCEDELLDYFPFSFDSLILHLSFFNCRSLHTNLSSYPGIDNRCFRFSEYSKLNRHPCLPACICFCVMGSQSLAWGHLCNWIGDWKKV